MISRPSRQILRRVTRWRACCSHGHCAPSAVPCVQPQGTSRSFSAGMDAFMEFEREMMQKKRSSQPKKYKRTGPLTPPVKPEDDECCKLDCPNCVLLVYQEKLLEYEESLKAETDAPAKVPPPDPKYVVTFLDAPPTEEQQALMRGNERTLFEVAENSVISASHNTKDNWSRSVRHIDLHVKEDQRQYVSDDASNIAVYVPNDTSIVDRMIARLQVDPDLVVSLSHVDGMVGEPAHQHLDRPFAKIGSVREMLTWTFDLVSTPRSGFLRLLSAYATDEQDATALRMPQAMERIKASRSAQLSISVADVFDLYPSIQLSFASFVQIAPLNPPRYYTVSSSRRFFPDIVSITLGLRQLGTQPTPRCSNYLSTLVPGQDSVRASFLQSSFVFPRQNRRPIMLVSAGTGIAPFRAFIQDLAHEHEQFHQQPQASPPPRQAYLFYGCRRPEVDFLYSQDIQRAHEKGLLQELHVAFSDVPQQPYHYVQDALLAHPELVGRHLVDDDGYVFVCGSLAMGRSVKKALAAALQTTDNTMTQEQAKTELTRRLETGQIVTELW